MSQLLPLAGAPAAASALGAAPPTPLRILGVVAFYWAVSLSVVFLNKSILSMPDFQFPIFVTWYQLLVALFLLFAAGHLGKLSVPPPTTPPLPCLPSCSPPSAGDGERE
jgi:hypothetical protein